MSSPQNSLNSSHSSLQFQQPPISFSGAEEQLAKPFVTAENLQPLIASNDANASSSNTGINKVLVAGHKYYVDREVASTRISIIASVIILAIGIALIVMVSTPLAIVAGIGLIVSGVGLTAWAVKRLKDRDNVEDSLQKGHEERLKKNSEENEQISTFTAEETKDGVHITIYDQANLKEGLYSTTEKIENLPYTIQLKNTENDQIEVSAYVFAEKLKGQVFTVYYLNEKVTLPEEILASEK